MEQPGADVCGDILAEHPVTQAWLKQLALLEIGPTVNIARGGPTAAARRLKEVSVSLGALDEWAERARVRAIVGRCPGTVDKIHCGVRAWLRFHEARFGHLRFTFPPRVPDLLAWADLFECSGTLSNYLRYVRTVCEVAEIDTTVFDHRSVRGAKLAVKKSLKHVPRDHMAIRIDVLRELVVQLSASQHSAVAAMVFVAAYSHMLRVPSECLVVAVRSPGYVAVCKRERRREGPIACVHNDCIEWYFSSGRKNDPLPSSILRECWCKRCKDTCPVHVLGAFLSKHQCGDRPFAGITKVRPHAP